MARPLSDSTDFRSALAEETPLNIRVFTGTRWVAARDMHPSSLQRLSAACYATAVSLPKLSRIYAENRTVALIQATSNATISGWQAGGRAFEVLLRPLAHYALRGAENTAPLFCLQFFWCLSRACLDKIFACIRKLRTKNGLCVCVCVVGIIWSHGVEDLSLPPTSGGEGLASYGSMLTSAVEDIRVLFAQGDIALISAASSAVSGSTAGRLAELRQAQVRKCTVCAILY